MKYEVSRDASDDEANHFFRRLKTVVMRDWWVVWDEWKRFDDDLVFYKKRGWNLYRVVGGRSSPAGWGGDSEESSSSSQSTASESDA